MTKQYFAGVDMGTKDYSMVVFFSKDENGKITAEWQDALPLTAGRWAELQEKLTLQDFRKLRSEILGQ